MRKKRRMMTGGRLLAFAALLGLTVACGGEASEDASPEVAQGRALFAGTCASCHGRDGHGMPQLGKDLHNNEYVQSLSQSELAAFFMKGRPINHPLNERGIEMPPSGGNPSLTMDDMQKIAAYVLSLQ